MTFTSSGAPKSRRGISFVLCCQLLHCISDKCHVYNIIIDYISREAPSTLKPTLDFKLQKFMIRKGSFGWQLMLWEMEKRMVGEESRLLSSFCREYLTHRKVPPVHDLCMLFDQPLQNFFLIRCFMCLLKFNIPFSLIDWCCKCVLIWDFVPEIKMAVPEFQIELTMGLEFLATEM